ncbi:MAG: pyridoxal phosphate-dependent aminotransferase [Thermoplasmatota archaeon]
MRPFSKSMGRIGTESAFEVLARAKALERQGKRVLYFNIGEPDFPTAPNIIEAAKRALDAGYTHYVPAPGIPEAREAICEYINRTRGFRPSVDQVLITPGAKPIMTFTMMALCERGDRVVYPDPGFPIYESMIRYIGARPVPIKLRERNEFRMDPEELKRKVSEKTKLIIINSPHNPTGSALNEEDVRTVADLCRDKGIWLLSDEVYNEILYEGKHHSPSVYDRCLEHTILLDGLSKTYAMTGWRLGYGVMPPELHKWETLLTINSVSCTSAFSQMALREALLGPQDSVRAMVEEFRRRRDFIVNGLNQVRGWSCLRPRGAFYVFPNIKRLKQRSKDVEGHLLNDLGIATLCGTAFGRGGEGYMRLSYASSLENIKEMIELLKNEYGSR